MQFINTRKNDEILTTSQAILKGLSDNGGLFVPQSIPHLNVDFSKISNLNYSEHAYSILSPFFNEFTEDELKQAISKAYSHGQNGNFSIKEIAHLTQFGKLSFLELYHGNTLSFKDMALSLLPHLIEISSQKESDIKHKIILTATSGDTGKAALEAFKNVKNTTVIVFYPENGVSPLQKQTMVTQEGNNVYVFGVKGNFDDAQRGVKQLLSSKDLKIILQRKNATFSSANSINIGRLLPQIVYYFYAYSNLIKNGLKNGQNVNFVVPTGNFGNILSGFYAKQMGLPINKLICATNKNNILYDFFTTGTFNTNRNFFTTISPAMDINLPSNFERLLFNELHSDDSLNNFLKDLTLHGKFSLDKKFNDFVSYHATEEETRLSIQNVYKKYNYIVDPHTAVGYHAYESYIRDFKDDTSVVIISTASPYKFTKTVMNVLKNDTSELDDFSQIERLREIKNDENPPLQIVNIQTKKVLHNKTITTNCMEKEVISIINSIS